MNGSIIGTPCFIYLFLGFVLLETWDKMGKDICSLCHIHSYGPWQTVSNLSGYSARMFAGLSFTDIRLAQGFRTGFRV